MSNINTGMLNTKYQIPNTVLKGFTLIEAMVSLFIFSIITMAFYQAWFLATDHIVNVKNRLGATALANEQMEIVRSLVFDDIGTTTGVPVGIIAEYQTITKNTAVYTVHTVVRFVDDPQDGTAALATDIAPNDYKKITIEVSWGSSSPSEAVEVISNVSLDGVESVAAGTGVLSINILNNAGDGISGADVHIVNNDVSPNIDMTDDTDVLGNTTFPGAPESAQSYQISVSKTGYYGNTTYPPNPISSFNPLNVHSSVVAGSLTPVTLITDQISTIDFYTKDPFDVAIPNINFSISGGLMIGNDTESG
ncbi:MAG TPA: prepilin-type N-terminal cleavage/methylation domain-containing protein, partial [Patescibacteria group bacterium]|nr:prepilin-type N-terminal cleavage/methylation domain-containing protein [Patescibacteria group bacterium]